MQNFIFEFIIAAISERESPSPLGMGCVQYVKLHKVASPD